MLPYGLILAVAAVSGGAGPREGARPQERAVPRLQVLKAVHDAGRITPGPRLRIVFPIRNAGQAPLEIQRVRLGCGCLAVEYERRLAPGASGAICVLFDTARLRGQVEKHVRVETNDPSTPRATLAVKALAQPLVEVSPGEEILLPLEPGRPVEQELTLRSRTGKPLRVTHVRCASAVTRARVLPAAEIQARLGESAPEVQIVQLSFPAQGGERAFEETVTLVTDCPGASRLVVRLWGVPRGAVTATPPRLYLGTVSRWAEEPVVRIVSLYRPQGPVKILDVSSGPGLRVTVAPGMDASEWDLTVIYQGGWTPGVVSGKLTIRTDDPQRPLLRVPYTAEVTAEPEPGDAAALGAIPAGKDR
jgi:Protein of unknown function (DUF1573)